MAYNSTTITLPSGATVELKDPRTLLVRDRNKVLECAEHESNMMKAIGMQNGLIAVMVADWSFELVPPSIKLESLEELTPADYEALIDACMPAQKALFPSLVENPVNVLDPKASTANSND